MLVGSKVRHLSKFEMTPCVGERPESAHCRLRPAATFDRIAAKSLSNRGEAASTAWVLGQIHEALPLAERALADAESAAHPPTMGVVLAIAALLGLVRCNPEAVATYGHASADVVSRYDLPAFWGGLAAFFQGWAKWSDGAGESRLAEMRRGLA